MKVHNEREKEDDEPSVNNIWWSRARLAMRDARACFAVLQKRACTVISFVGGKKGIYYRYWRLV